MPPASGDNRYALIIAVSEYQDAGLDNLVAPRRDADDLAAVLRRPDIGNFRDVEVLIDPDHAAAQLRIAKFFGNRDWQDIAVLHFSGHGILGEEHDELFLAMSDTSRQEPDATSVPGVFLRQVIRKSPARRKLLLLDCCHSGALTLDRDLNRRARPPGPADRARTAKLFQGGIEKIAPEPASSPDRPTGTVIIGAARAGELSRETHTGALTGAVVEGLATGEADLHHTGKISTDDLFGHVTRWFASHNLPQHPVVQQRSVSGRFIVAENCAFQPIALPGDLEELLLASDPAARAAAVAALHPLTLAADHEIAMTAFRRLQHLAGFDMFPAVSVAARTALAGLVPRPDPDRVQFGTVAAGERVAPQTVRIVAPPPAREWTARVPDDAAVTVFRHDDRLEVTLDTTHPGRVHTTIVLDSPVGPARIEVSAKVRPPTDAVAPPPRPRRPLGRRRRLALALPLVAVLALAPGSSVPPGAGALGACVPGDDLRVLTTDALRDAIGDAAAGFAARRGGEDCPEVRVTVSAVSADGVAQRQFARQWPDDDLRAAGPNPDVWLPESSLQVDLARDGIPADAPHRLELPGPAAARAASVAGSKLVLAVPDTVAPAGPLRLSDVLARPGTIPRADPRDSSTGLLATAALYDAAGKNPQAAERILERGQGGDDARYDLCSYRLSTVPPPPDTAFLVPAAFVAAYTAGKPLGAACQANQSPPLNRGLRAIEVSDAPELDVPCIPVRESAWGDDRQRELAAEFCAYLRGDGQRILQAHDLGPRGPTAAQHVPDAARAGAVINEWSAAQRPVRMLLVMDVSGSMDLPMPDSRTSRIAASRSAAQRALARSSLGRDDQAGLWEFATRLSGARDYRQLVPLAPVTADHQRGLGAALDGLRATNSNTGLYDTISAGITALRPAKPVADGEFAPINLLVVLTDGENDDRGSIGVSEIGDQLRNSGVQVSVIAAVGANCRSFQPLLEQGLGCFDESRGGLDAAFDQALPSRRALE